jgi:hypothetical protein
MLAIIIESAFNAAFTGQVGEASRCEMVGDDVACVADPARD